jgi:membrane protease YdiL (CAAX protease family)
MTATLRHGFVALFLCSFLALRLAHAEEARGAPVAKNPIQQKAQEGQLQSKFTPPRNPERPRGYIWPPIYSLMIPGLDQWIERQYVPAATYSSISALSSAYSLRNYQRLYDYQQTNEYRRLTPEEKEDRMIHGELERKVALSQQLAGGPLSLGLGAMSSLSAYHSFRTAVTTRYQFGQFTFLDPAVEETTADLALAPFKFKYLARPTTIVPLAIIATVYAMQTGATYEESDEYRKDKLDNSDIFYGSGISYLAGVHEEALFRGWMMPVFMQWTGSPFWSNTITASTFALAHLSTNGTPLPQLMLGWYLGWLSQRRQWTLSESIFIHAWWDVFALMGSYQVRRKEAEAILPVIWLPPLQMVF